MFSLILGSQTFCHILSTVLDISPPLTFHAFGWAEASWAFKQGIPLKHIMKHGLGGLMPYESYLSSFPFPTSPISLPFWLPYILSPT